MQKIDYRIEKAEVFLRFELLDEAEELLQEAAINNAENGRLLFNFGNISILRGKKQKAREYYKKAIENGYLTEKCFFNYAICLRAMGDFQEAFHVLTEGAEKIEECFLIEKAIVIWQIQMGKTFAASESLKRLLERYPDKAECHYLNCVIQILKEEFSAAQRTLDFMVERDFLERNSFLQLNLQATIAIKARKEELAKQCFKQLHQEYQYDKATIALAMLVALDEDYVRAVSYLDPIVQGEDYTHEYFIAIYLYAFCMKQVQIPEYEEVIKAAITICKRDYDAHPDLIYIKQIEMYCYNMLNDKESEASCKEIIDDYLIRYLDLDQPY